MLKHFNKKGHVLKNIWLKYWLLERDKKWNYIALKTMEIALHVRLLTIIGIARTIHYGAVIAKVPAANHLPIHANQFVSGLAKKNT